MKSAPGHPTDEGTVVILTEARRSHIPLASLIPSSGTAVLRGAGNSVFPRKCEWIWLHLMSHQRALYGASTDPGEKLLLLYQSMCGFRLKTSFKIISEAEKYNWQAKGLNTSSFKSTLIIVLNSEYFFALWSRGGWGGYKIFNIQARYLWKYKHLYLLMFISKSRGLHLENNDLKTYINVFPGFSNKIILPHP